MRSGIRGAPRFPGQARRLLNVRVDSGGKAARRLAAAPEPAPAPGEAAAFLSRFLLRFLSSFACFDSLAPFPWGPPSGVAARRAQVGWKGLAEAARLAFFPEARFRSLSSCGRFFAAFRGALAPRPGTTPERLFPILGKRGGAR